MLAGCGAHMQPHLTGLVIPYPTMLALARETSELTLETAWCLTGEIKDDSVAVISGISAPLVENRTETSVEFYNCDADNVIGWYHNHPYVDRDNCFASEIDVYTTNANDQFLVALIGCNRQSFVYFFQGQIVQYKILPSHYLPN